MDAAQSVYQNQPKHSHLLISWISPLLFNAPYTQLRAIEAMHLDQWLNYTLWHNLFTRLRSEWFELVLYVRKHQFRVSRLTMTAFRRGPWF